MTEEQPVFAPDTGRWPRSMLLPLVLLFLATVYYRLERAPRILHFENPTAVLGPLISGAMSPQSLVEPRMGGTSIVFGGPLLDILHLPPVLAKNPVLGLHLTYAAYELLALGLWLLIGLRGGVPPALIWTAAAAMAVLLAGLDALAENTVLAGYMSVPLFIVLARALDRGRAPAFVVAGMIFGLAMSVQFGTALLAGLPCLIAMLVARNRLPVLQRLLWFGAGILPVVLFALPFSSVSTPFFIQSEGPRVGNGWGEITASLRGWLGLVLRDPLWLGGIALISFRRLRGIRPSAIELLGVIWMLVGLPLSVMAFSYLVKSPSLFRLALLLPGWAVLDAVALTRLVGWIGSLLPARSVFRRIGPRYLFAVPVLALGALFAARSLALAEQNRQDLRENPHAYSVYNYRMAEVILNDPLFKGNQPIYVFGASDVDWISQVLSYSELGSQWFPSEINDADTPMRCLFVLKTERRGPVTLPKGVWPIGGGLIATPAVCLDNRDLLQRGAPIDLPLDVPGLGLDELPIVVWLHSKHGRRLSAETIPEVELRRAGQRYEPVRRYNNRRGHFFLYYLPVSASGEDRIHLHLPALAIEVRVLVMALFRATEWPIP